MNKEEWDEEINALREIRDVLLSEIEELDNKISEVIGAGYWIDRRHGCGMRARTNITNKAGKAILKHCSLTYTEPCKQFSEGGTITVQYEETPSDATNVPIKPITLPSVSVFDNPNGDIED